MKSEIKIIAPMWFLLSIGIIISAIFIFPESYMIPRPWNLIGLMFMGFGLGLAMAAMKLFRERNLKPEGYNPPERLIISGVYRISRNPMYLGFSISLLGIWIYMGNLHGLFAVPLFFVIIDRLYVTFEERTMQRVFGEGWARYASEVRRWI